MGLDMYLTGESFYTYDHPNRQLKPFPLKESHYGLGYWRKHPNLHGYIVQCFSEGEDNCQKVELDKDQLAQVITAVQSRQLPETTGFFFGESRAAEEQVASDVAVFEAAILWLEEKSPGEWRSVSYRASW